MGRHCWLDASQIERHSHRFAWHHCQKALQVLRERKTTSNQASKRKLGQAAEHDGSRWKLFAGKNCYTPHGGENVDLEGDNKRPKYMAVDEAKRTVELKGYAGFAHKPSNNQTWFLKRIDDPSKFRSSGGKYNVWMFHS